ncbi:MAG TPA: peptidoglycan-binding protein [Nocardioidaceae bacterium]|nr:peptidoglycan-binding protein [Nocardioidaceae bacterium]
MTFLPGSPGLRRHAVPLVTALTALSVAALPAVGATAAASGASGPAPFRAEQPTRIAAAPVPGVPGGLPADIEDLAGYVAANSCDPHAKPGATALGDLLRSTYQGSSYGIDRTCGTDPLPTSEHYDGRALDWFRDVRVARERADAEAVLSWLFARDAAGNRYANARRLGVMYVIWNNRIWGSYRAAEGWRSYMGCSGRTSRAYDTTCHRDHIHISLSWEGAMGRTSFWSGDVAPRDYGPCRERGLNWAAPYVSARSTACPGYPRVTAPASASALTRTLTTYSGMVLGRGDTGPVVAAVQRAVGAGVDGIFGALTSAAVGSWQGSHSVPVTGVVDAPTWRALLRAAPVPVPGKSATSPGRHPELTRYRGITLRMGAHRPAVAALQRRLGVTADGRFGPVTRAAVKRFQRRHHLPVTGVVGRRTWRALGA